MKDDELAQKLSEWFQNNQFNPNKWNRGVGKLIKNKLDYLGNWKNKPRGNPRAGGLERKRLKLIELNR